jgi:diaminopimelate decarboxylase
MEEPPPKPAPNIPQLAFTRPRYNTLDAMRIVSEGKLAPLSFGESGRLKLGGHRLSDLAEHYGSPIVIYTTERLKENAHRIQTAFNKAFKKTVRIAFATKSCYLPPIIRTLIESDWDIEVMSSFELDLVLELGVIGDRITLTGLGWGGALCERALAAGVGRFVVDCDADALALSQAATRLGTAASMFARVNLEESVGGTFLPKNSKLGCPPSALIQWLRRLGDLPGLNLKGLHIHQANRLEDLQLYQRILEAFASTIREVAENGFRISEIDLGGGFESLWRLDCQNCPIESFAKAAALKLDLDRFDCVRLEVGRAVVADAAVAVGNIIAVKESPETNWVIVDVPMNTLIPITGAKYLPLPVTLHSDRDLVPCSFSDGTGSPLAYYELTPFPNPKVGDAICFIDAGAYTTVFNELWAQELPNLLIVGESVVTYRNGHRTSAITRENWLGPGAWEEHS